MSEDQNKKPTPPATSFLKQNLQGFLQPPLMSTPPVAPTASEPETQDPVPQPPAPPDASALHLRMSQMELANRLKLQNGGKNQAVPIARNLPPGGFGSAQGIMHLRRGDFGKKPQPSVSPATASPETEHQSDQPEVLEVPKEAEVRTDRPQRRSRRFQNPSL